MFFHSTQQKYGLFIINNEFFVKYAKSPLSKIKFHAIHT